MGNRRRHVWNIDEDLEAEYWQLPPETLRELRPAFPGATGIKRVQVYGTGELPTLDELVAECSDAFNPASVSHSMRVVSDGWVETWLLVAFDNARTQVFHSVVIAGVGRVAEALELYELPRHAQTTCEMLSNRPYNELRSVLFVDIISTSELIGHRHSSRLALYRQPGLRSGDDVRLFRRSDAPEVLLKFETLIKRGHAVFRNPFGLALDDICGTIEMQADRLHWKKGRHRRAVWVRLMLEAWSSGEDSPAIVEFSAEVDCVAEGYDTNVVLCAVFEEVSGNAWQSISHPTPQVFGNVWIGDRDTPVVEALQMAEPGVPLSGSGLRGPQVSVLSELRWGWLLFRAHGDVDGNAEIVPPIPGVLGPQ